jgi:hypothetical protein
VVFIGAVELMEEVVDRTRAGRSWRAAWFEFDRRGREPCPAAQVRISDFQASSQAAVFLECFTVSASGRRGGAGGHAARRQRSYGAQFKEKL